MKKIVVIAVLLLVGIYEFPLFLRQYARMVHKDNVLPVTELPLDQPVDIYMNEYQVPYIRAKTDHDLAFTLGLLHAHYRLPQIELSRLISQGKLSTIFGPKANGIDHTLRILQFGKAADEIIEQYPKETLAWLQAYLDGLNHYITTAKDFPWDLQVMHIQPTPWTMKDLVTMHRMASADVNWMYLAAFLRDRTNPEWEKIWNMFIEHNQGSIPSNSDPIPNIGDLIHGFTKSGSNSLVVAGGKTSSGAGMIASDPHISTFLPSLWFLCGMESPSYHAVGMMVPGMPFIALGRNESIAWGATNMYSISSYLYELDKNEPLQSHDEKISSRFGKDSTVTIRNSKFGPVITDSPYFQTDRQLALYWQGHQPSDEVSAFLKIQKARNWEQFETAFHSYAVLGLNYVYADRAGNIGYVPAFTQPLTKSAQKKLWYSPSEYSETAIPESMLTRIHNPKQGFIATSNNRPSQVDRDWGWFYAPNDRVLRQSALIHPNSKVTVDDLKKLQLDVTSISAQRWIAWMAANSNDSVHQNALFKKLIVWPCDYEKEKIEPLIFEFLIHDLSSELLGSDFKERQSIQKIQQSTFIKEWLQKHLMSKSLDERSNILLHSLQRIKPMISSYDRWGQFHQMKLQYMFGYIPWLGRAFELETYPVSGSSDTIYKRAYVMNEKSAYVTYGSNARHISDLSDSDSNYFVIFGSQNGYPFSKNNADQIELWENQGYMQLPLRFETVEKTFKTILRLQPR